jgi:hypothetical protein
LASPLGGAHIACDNLRDFDNVTVIRVQAADVPVAFIAAD